MFMRHPLPPPKKKGGLTSKRSKMTVGFATKIKNKEKRSITNPTHRRNRSQRPETDRSGRPKLGAAGSRWKVTKRFLMDLGGASRWRLGVPVPFHWNGVVVVPYHSLAIKTGRLAIETATGKPTTGKYAGHPCYWGGIWPISGQNFLQLVAMIMGVN